MGGCVRGRRNEAHWTHTFSHTTKPDTHARTVDVADEGAEGHERKETLLQDGGQPLQRAFLSHLLLLPLLLLLFCRFLELEGRMSKGGRNNKEEDSSSSKKQLSALYLRKKASPQTEQKGARSGRRRSAAGPGGMMLQGGCYQPPSAGWGERKPRRA